MPRTSHPPNGKDTASTDGCQYCGRRTVGEKCPSCGYDSFCDLCKVCWTDGCGYDASLGDLLTMPVADILRGEGAKRRELADELLRDGGA